MGLRYEIKNDEITITGYTDKSTKSVIIPELIDGLPVTRIIYFGYLNSVESLIIPKSVTYIGCNAFEYTMGMKYINNREIKNGFCVINNRFIMFNWFIYFIKHQISEDYVANIQDHERLFINNIR